MFRVNQRVARALEALPRIKTGFHTLPPNRKPSLFSLYLEPVTSDLESWMGFSQAPSSRAPKPVCSPATGPMSKKKAHRASSDGLTWSLESPVLKKVNLPDDARSDAGYIRPFLILGKPKFAEMS